MAALDGRKIARDLERDVKRRARNTPVSIATVVVEGTDESLLFARLKECACRRTGIDHRTVVVEKPEETAVLAEIRALNEDAAVSGINVQLPLPETVDFTRIASAITVAKDIEGVHPVHLGRLLLGSGTVVPCIPAAVMHLLDVAGTTIEGRHAVIVNHSAIIGKPLSLLLVSRNATVSVCHVYTSNLADFTRRADILVTATGVAGLITGDHVGAPDIIVDAGIRVVDGAVFGDVAPDAAQKARTHTPVPGGVGPVTIACMLKNAVATYENIQI
jgi:methylenetetrahydrofolate dehydrogenase (NADP+)/methenyltetrahydrofolate cyclohydrolase